MYQKFQTDELPETKDTIIWRYMDFAKLASLLHTGALYFCRADKLGDRFECSLPQRFFDNLEAKSAAMQALIDRITRATELREQQPSGIRDMERADTERDAGRAMLRLQGQLSATKRNAKVVIDNFSRMANYYYTHAFISCWHVNEDESMAMWDLYARDKKGIAIMSTLERLIDVVSSAPDTIRVSTVKYLNFNTYIHKFNDTNIPLNLAYKIPFIKRESFEHERELRAMIDEQDEGKSKEDGKYIRVPLEKLIMQVRVAPGARDWFKEAVEGVVKKYSSVIKVEKSPLDGDVVR